MADLFTDPSWRPMPARDPFKRKRGGFRALALTGLAVLGMGGIGLYVMLDRNATINLAATPVIQPEMQVMKERPVDAGGIEVPHQEAVIYQQIERGKPKEKVEQLLAPSERPDARALAAPKSAPVIPVISAEQNVTAAKPEIRPNPPAAVPVAPVSVANVPAEKPVDKSVNKTEEKPAGTVQAQAAQPAPAQAVTQVQEPQPIPSPQVEKPSEISSLQPSFLALPKSENPANTASVDKPVDNSGMNQEKPLDKPVDNLIAKIADNKPDYKPKTQEVAKAESASSVTTPSAPKDQVNTSATSTLDSKKLLAKIGVGAPSNNAEILAVRAPPPDPTPPAPNAAAGMARVQLASSPDRDAAEQKMLDMVDKHAPLLRKAKLSVNRAEIAGRGTYFRIQTQALPAAEASSLCQKLQSNGLSCVVMRSP
jgi:hypothetical protein